MCGIYLITNLITKKVYVGQSVNINRRWSEHKARAFNPNNNCYDKPLYRSMRKYGTDAFVLSVICECEPEQLNELEANYIKEFDCVTPNGYNVQTAEQVDVKNHTLRRCKNCGQIISYGTVHNLCRTCYTKSTRKVERPTPTELENLLRQSNFVAVGRMFGVTDKAIRKWCKAYGMSDKAKDYK